MYINSVIVPQGEARVIKQLMTRTVDLKSRRRKQERLREQELQQRRTKLINFVSDSDSCCEWVQAGPLS